MLAGLGVPLTPQDTVAGCLVEQYLLLPQAHCCPACTYLVYSACAPLRFVSHLVGVNGSTGPGIRATRPPAMTRGFPPEAVTDCHHSKWWCEKSVF